MEVTKLINGNPLNQDYDGQLLAKELVSAGVIEGLEVTTNLVSAGKAYIQVTRGGTPNQTFYVLYELTEDLIIDTSGTKKVFIEIPQDNVDNPALNTEPDGQGIAAIDTAGSLPASNFVSLADIVAGVITDDRTFIELDKTKYQNGAQEIINETFDDFTWKFRSRVAANSNKDLSTDLNPGDVVDTITLAAGDSVVLPFQTLPKENGIYVVQPSDPAIRSSNFNTSENVTTSLIPVTEGAINGSTVWRCRSTLPVIDTDPIVIDKVVGVIPVAPKFGGDGRDGAFSSSSGTTVINDIVKNYTQFTLNGTAIFNFNASLKNKTVIIKVLGDLTIGGTSTIRRDGEGALGGARGDPGFGNDSTGSFGSPGEAGDLVVNGNIRVQAGISQVTSISNKGGGGGKNEDPSTVQYRRMYSLCGSGGQGGHAGNGWASGTDQFGTYGGAGGDGAGGILFEVGGDVILDGTPTFSSDGDDGEDGESAAAPSTGGGGGGGGGASSVWLILHNGSLNDTSTPNLSFNGGAGGAGGSGNGSALSGQVGQAGENGGLEIQQNDTLI